jgi:arylsulfatase A-like enzyme
MMNQSKWILPFLIGANATNAVATEKPNIILIYIDDMGFADLTSFGGPYQTPNIDQLAKEGIRFSQYYSACPISSPSRVAVTTGMYPARWGINTFLQTRNGNANAEQNDFLNSAAPSLAKTLKQNGYATAHFGKWHMGGGRDVYNAPSIMMYGFDEYSSTWESPNPDPKLTSTNWIWADTDVIKRWDRTAYFVDKTLDFLARNKDSKPAYINLWPDDVHTPFVENEGGKSSPKDNWEKESAFTAVLTEMDKQIGRLMQGIKDLGLEEETLILFTSDNGPNPRYVGRRTLNMRGQKSQLYEGGIRMPFIAHWPGKIAPNQYNSQSVFCSVDLFPSLCAITGTPLPTDFQLDGLDMSNVMLGATQDNRPQPLFWQFGKTLADPKSPHIAVRDGDWKLLVDIDGGRTELYNMKTDFLESKNVASANPEITNRLKPMALQWFGQAYRQYADWTSDVEQIPVSQVIRVFPNPVGEILNIHAAFQTYKVSVLNLSGETIIPGKQQESKIDVSTLNKGIYFLMLESENKKYYSKFIKE